MKKLLIALAALVALASPAFAADKVALCHATNSETNPYVLIEVAAAGAYNGHLGDGHQNGEDIIPPFEFRGETYSQNWDAEGQAIFENGCEVEPSPSPSPSPSETPSPSPDPSPPPRRCLACPPDDGDPPLTDDQLPKELADTGFSAVAAGGIGTALLALGALSMWAARREPRSLSASARR